MQVDFKFKPLQRVKLTAYNLNFNARILCCVKSAADILAYRIEYSEDGAIQEGTFFEDDLEAV